MNSCDPMKPPRIVIHSLDAKLFLNICMPANVRTVRRAANTNEVAVGRAVRAKRRYLLGNIGDEIHKEPRYTHPWW